MSFYLKGHLRRENKLKGTIEVNKHCNWS